MTMCPKCGSADIFALGYYSYACAKCRYVWAMKLKECNVDDDSSNSNDTAILSRAEVASPVFCHGCIHSHKGFDCEELNCIDGHKWEWLVVEGKRPTCWSVKGYTAFAEDVMGGKIKKIQYLPEFQQYMENRLLQGAMKYGDNDWKFGDNLQDILEEVIDIANYAYFFFSRLRWIEEHGNPPYYLNPCRVKEISHQPPERQQQLIAIFEEYRVCYKVGDDQRHFCLNSAGIEAQSHPERSEEKGT